MTKFSVENRDIAHGFEIVSQQCEKDGVADLLWSKRAFVVQSLTGPRGKALGSAFVAFLVLGALWWGGHLWHRNTLLREARGRVLAALDPYGNALTSELRRRFELVYALSAWATTDLSIDKLRTNFESFAEMLSHGVAGVRYFTLAPGGVEQLVYPRAGNEAILGGKLLDDPRSEIREDVARAIDSRKLVISGPYRLLVSGELGAVARLAIHRNDKFWGLINVAVDIAPMLAEAGITKEKRLQIALRDTRKRVFFGAANIDSAGPVVHQINLSDGDWELAAVPVNGWNSAIAGDLRIFDGFVLTAVLLVSTVVYLLAFRDARLAAAVDRRTGEIRDAKDSLAKAEERYRRLVDLSPDAVFVNFKNSIVYANGAALRLLGATRAQDLIGRSPLEFVAPEFRPQVEERICAMLAAAHPAPSYELNLRLDRSTADIASVAAPLQWEDGTAVQVIMRDVSELRKGEAWLRGLIETTQDAVISIDRQAHVVMFNPAAETIFGYGKAEILGEKVNLLMAEPYATEHDGYIASYEKTGEARAIGRIRNVVARRKNGENFPIELSVAKIGSGDEVRYAAFIRDVSDKVKLQNQAVENERLATIGTMAAKFGHELGNPLNGMSLTIQLLEQRLKRQSPPADEQVVSLLTRLKIEISRLNALLQDFRSLSRKERFNFQPTAVSALVGEAIEIELPRYGEQGIAVESTFPGDLPRISVDIDKMKQVILNLAKNAVDAMPAGGKLSFSASATESTVTLHISDTGCGIPAETDIFEPFFTTKSFGTGIGLTIVRQIVYAHNGSITYSSEAGKGTTFSVTLPRT